MTTATMSPTTLTCSPNDAARSGGLWREMYTGISGTSVADLLGSMDFPDNPAVEEELALFEGPTNVADLYGTRVRGIFYAPETGNYTFWVSGDDNTLLKLSTNAQGDQRPDHCERAGLVVAQAVGQVS